MSFPLSPQRRIWLRAALAALVLLLVAGAYLGWSRGFREEPQPAWVFESGESRFRYGSIGAEHDAGIPYWIFYVLPRVFPEKFRQDGQQVAGGYAALGVAWEQGQELPAGFTKKTIGFPRVGNNCAACHTASYRRSADANPVFVSGGPGHTVNIENFFRLLIECARDPRFNADILMAEINRVTHLDVIDQLLYRFVIIPVTRKRLLEREAQFAWIFRPDFPEWGRGRDDGMNLTRYFMLKAPMDDRFGPADIPAVWNLAKYKAETGQLPNYAGDTHDVHSVMIDSALGVLGAAPADKADFQAQVKWLQDYLSALAPPAYPFPVDAARAAAGKAVFDAHCAACHASPRTGTRLPLAEVGTDSGRLDTWDKASAIEANRVAASMGINRKGLVEEDLPGYKIPFLDGIWLRAPYLHNGAVPTLRDLLEPVERRPRVFWRGYDVFDPVKVGFVTDGDEAKRVGTRMDVSQRGSGNQGHEFGTGLPAADKEVLVEYLKTL
jgi:mono/diheme cytochrome c family protein